MKEIGKMGGLSGPINQYFADAPVNKNFSVRTEIGYLSGFGSQCGDKNNPVDATTLPALVQTNRISYLSFAILPTYHISHCGLAFYLGAAMAKTLNSAVTNDFYCGNKTARPFTEYLPTINH